MQKIFGFGTRQIRKAAVSVMSNIAEGFYRASRTEHHFLVIAGRVPKVGFSAMLRLATETSLVINDLEHQNKNKEISGDE